MLSLRPGTSALRVLDTLRETLSGLQNVEGTSRDAPDALKKYLSWANNSVRMLSSPLKAADVDRLITSRRYWVLQGLNPGGSNSLRELIDVEITERKTVIESEIKELSRDLTRWKELSDPTVAVLDTNVLLDHHQELAVRDWRGDLALDPSQALVLAVPMAVVDELDRLKHDRKNPHPGELPLRTRARQALRYLEDAFKQPDEWVTLTLNTADLGATHLALIADHPEHTPLSHVDSEIVDRALTLKPFANVVILIVYDTGIVLRARIAGLTTHLMKDPSDDN